MTPFLVGRFLTLFLAGVAFAGFMLAMLRSHDFLRNVPMLAITGHGFVYYAVYLVFYLHPRFPFSLQAFADWGSVLLFQIFCTLALIGWDIATDFFTGHFWPFIREKRGGLRAR